MNSRKLLAAGAAALLGLVLGAAPSQAVELRYKFKAGEKLEYRDWAALAMESGPEEGDPDRLQLKIDSQIRQTIKKVDGHHATVDVETTDNQTETLPATGKSTKKEDKNDPERLRIDDRGMVLERKSLGKEAKKDPEPVDLFAIVQQVFDHLRLPEGNVEPGDDWTESLDLNLTPNLDKANPIKGSYTSKFVRVVKLNGQDAVEISTEFHVPLKSAKPIETEGMKLSVDGELFGKLLMYFSVERGRSLVETGSFGAHTEMTIGIIKGKADKIKLNRTLKVNTKTVLQD